MMFHMSENLMTPQLSCSMNWANVFSMVHLWHHNLKQMDYGIKYRPGWLAGERALYLITTVITAIKSMAVQPLRQNQDRDFIVRFFL